MDTVWGNNKAAADSMDMVLGNNKAAADNDMAPVRGSRLCIHDRKDRTRGKPPFQMLVPFTLFLYARYGVRTTGKKKTPVIIRHLFLHFHIN